MIPVYIDQAGGQEWILAEFFFAFFKTETMSRSITKKRTVLAGPTREIPSGQDGQSTGI